MLPGPSSAIESQLSGGRSALDKHRARAPRRLVHRERQKIGCTADRPTPARHQRFCSPSKRLRPKEPRKEAEALLKKSSGQIPCSSNVRCFVEDAKMLWTHLEFMRLHIEALCSFLSTAWTTSRSKVQRSRVPMEFDQ